MAPRRNPRNGANRPARRNDSSAMAVDEEFVDTVNPAQTAPKQKMTPEAAAAAGAALQSRAAHVTKKQVEGSEEKSESTPSETPEPVCQKGCCCRHCEDQGGNPSKCAGRCGCCSRCSIGGFILVSSIGLLTILLIVALLIWDFPKNGPAPIGKIQGFLKNHENAHETVRILAVAMTVFELSLISVATVAIAMRIGGCILANFGCLVRLLFVPAALIMSILIMHEFTPSVLPKKLMPYLSVVPHLPQGIHGVIVQNVRAAINEPRVHAFVGPIVAALRRHQHNE